MDKLVINEHMDMRWHEGKPRIFIDDKPFMHCAFLVVAVDTADPANEQATVDDLAARPGARRLEGRDAMTEYGLTKDDVLWGFYSSIVGWVESGYNTQVIHTNLAFPLLRELARVGDPKAKRVLKGEIHDRLLSRSAGTVVTIIETCADIMDAEDWAIIYGMMKETKREGLITTALVAKGITSGLQVGRFKLGSEHQPLVDELIDYANDSNDVLVAQQLAYSMPFLPQALADRVSLHLSPGISDHARGYMAMFTRLPDVLAKLAKGAIENLDEATPRKLWQNANEDVKADLHVLAEVFLNHHVTAEIIDKTVRKLLKKDLSDFAKGDISTWYELVIPVLGKALESKVATPELAETIARSDIIKAKNLWSRELMRWLSRAQIAKHIVLPLVWVNDDVEHDLYLHINISHYIVKDQYFNSVFECYTTDEIVEYLTWTGLDFSHVYAGATMKARILKAERDEPGKSIELYGHYTKHYMAGNIAGLKAFAKEKGLKFMRLMDNGRYTSVYYTPGDVWLLNTNYAREEWEKDKQGNWSRVSLEEKKPKADQYLLYKGERAIKSFDSYDAAWNYLRSIIADAPDIPNDFTIEKEELVWDPW